MQVYQRMVSIAAFTASAVSVSVALLVCTYYSLLLPISMESFTVYNTAPCVLLQGWEGALHSLGLHMRWKEHIASVVLCTALITLLFAGHVCAAMGTVLLCPGSASRGCISAFAHELLPLGEVVDTSQRHLALRNYAFAPLAEEVIFRGVMWMWLSAAGVAPLSAVLWGPSFFALGMQSAPSLTHTAACLIT
jgi:membrane protease YdiL (CAAX protease family)